MVGQNKQFDLLYRGSRDGFGGKEFHQKVDAKGPSLTIIKSKQFGRVFGGFTNIQYSLQGKAKKHSGQTFLFSVRDGDRPIVQLKHTNGAEITHRGHLFETAGPDLVVFKNGDKTPTNFSELGNGFELPPGFTKNDEELKTYLAGAKKFAIADIEVFQVK